MTQSSVDADLLRPERLAPALVTATGDEQWGRFEASLIAGGKSNLSYLLTSPAGELILRRPPTGDLLPSAHDMNREVRIQSALAHTGVPVATVVLSDPGDATIGAPFYVMEKVTGHIIRDAMPPGYADSAGERLRLADALVDTLAELHALGPNDIGLGDFGRPDGFLARQLRRWSTQSHASRTRETPALDELAARLHASVPTTSRTTIVHGDYRLDNCLMDLVEPGRVAAVLDWELSTLGDPLTDLGMLLLYWPEAGEPGIPLVPTVTGDGGFPGRAHLLERYADRSGTDLGQIGWYYAFAQFKFAVIIQGVQARSEAGAMGGQRFDNVDADVDRLAATGLHILEES
ncbi:phosphotransferase family protein [Streptomyces sp. NPDC056390]|uniref:phosphotransferase family protein n=1 Tax=Streptomyces sp. NPDC056390 TaxID=3345806 RepID=UPI0035DC2800